MAVNVTTPAEGFKYAIRLPANKVLHDSIAHLLKRPVGRPLSANITETPAPLGITVGRWR